VRTTITEPQSPQGWCSRPLCDSHQSTRLREGESAACALLGAERERQVVAQALRDETAQVLAAVMVGTASLASIEEILTVRAGLHDLRRSVETELERINGLAAALEARVKKQPAPR